MLESEILGLHNAYAKKHESELSLNVRTFMLESEVVSNYLQ